MHTRVGDGLLGLWDAAFCSHCQLNTNITAAKQLGFTDRVIPDSLLLPIAIRSLNVHSRLVWHYILIRIILAYFRQIYIVACQAYPALVKIAPVLIPFSFR